MEERFLIAFEVLRQNIHFIMQTYQSDVDASQVRKENPKIRTSFCVSLFTGAPSHTKEVLLDGRN